MPLYSLDGLAPKVPENGKYWVAPGAQVIGNVVLEEDTSVWFNAVLRGDNETITIGKGTNVQDNSVLHTDIGSPLTLGPYNTIGHNVVLHGCVTGEGVLIGMGATVLNGAKIGAHSIVGAGALVTEGKEFPECSLIVGSPAKVVRTLTPEQAEGIQRGVKSYVMNHQRFKAGLKLIAE